MQSLAEPWADPLRVLICEASAVQRSILRSILDDAGYVTETAAAGDAALDRIQSGPVDIVVTNIEHPQMSGLELCWRIKAEYQRQLIYTLVVTSDGDKRRLSEALDAGADDFVRKPYDENELRSRMRAAERIVRLNKELASLADSDVLTGAHNRRAFMSRLDEELTRADRNQAPLSLIMLDLDHFKRINDTFGHATGDTAIKATVAAIQQTLDRNEVVGRLGGEEFAVLLPNTNDAAAGRAAQRLRRDISQIVLQTKDGPQSFTASLGVVTRPASDRAAIEAMMVAADQALYRAKDAGRNCVTVAEAA